MKTEQNQTIKSDGEIIILAGRTAHDINNILGAIQMYCDLIKRKVNDTQTILECTSKIEFAANQAADISRHLLEKVENCRESEQ